MGLYDTIKDCINIAQKADNIPLVSELIDAQKQILDLIQENDSLKRQVKELKDIQVKAESIERHENAYITLKNEIPQLIYCSCCWDTKRLLVQGNIVTTGRYECPSCKASLFYDRNLYHESQAKAFSRLL